MENIKEIFKEKNYDEQTLNLIENFLYEFEEVFGKYLPREEVIKRIKANLDHSVLITNIEGNKHTGLYDSKEKKITLLEGMDEETLKSVFFHEMIHCITSYEKFVGFGLEYCDEDNPIRQTGTAIGITEGFTQLATKKRNERFGVKFDTYPILTEQVENIVELLGEDKFFDIAFNNPLGLEDAMLDAGLLEYSGEVGPFLEQFNTIWKHEKEIYEDRGYQKSKEERLLKAIFGLNKPKIYPVENAKHHIVITLLERYGRIDIKTTDELIELFNQTLKYAKQLDIQTSAGIYNTYFTKLDILEESGIPREEILEALPPEMRLFTEYEYKYREFMELSPREQLEKIAESPREVDEEILSGILGDDYATAIVTNIFNGFSDKNKSIDMATQLVRGFAQKILDEGYDIDKLAFEFIEIDGFVSGLAFNMYENDGENARYLGTFSNITSECDLEEYKACSEEERKRILAEKDLPDDYVVLSSESGCLILFGGDDEYLCIDDEGYSYENDGEVKYFGSNIEYLRERIQNSGKRYQQLVQLRAPQKILEDTSKSIRAIEEKIDEKRGKTKFTPGDIEEATLKGAISLEEIEAILEEFGDKNIDREKIFRKGIGLDE